MTPLYKNTEIQKIDQNTIRLGTTSSELIYRASKKFIQWLINITYVPENVHVICGAGNNGADGYKVGLLMANMGYRVSVFTVDLFASRSGENALLQKQIFERIDIFHQLIRSPNDIAFQGDNVILIDALLGNGINRPLTGNIDQFVTQISNKYVRIYGLDVPSGLMNSEHITANAMKCVATCAFEYPKLAFFAAEHEIFVGHWHYVSIGLISNSEKSDNADTFLLNKRDISDLIQPRNQFAHKGLMGRVLFMMSDSGMTGAVILAAKACINMGAGYTMILSSKFASQIIISSLPEVINVREPSPDLFSSIDVLSIGPGLGISERSTEQVKLSLGIESACLVLDADALNIIALNNLQNSIPKESILTPHIKEFEKLFGVCEGHFDRIRLQRKSSVSLGVYIVLKGRYTSISDPKGNIYYNKSGNPGLAKGGTGDVLTGMITALVAQGYAPLSACQLGVFLHGHAADLYARDFHELTVGPLNVISYFGVALQNIIKLNEN